MANKIGPTDPGDKIGDKVGDAAKYATFGNDGELEVHSNANEDVPLLTAPDIAEDPNFGWGEAEAALVSNVPLVAAKVKLTAIGGIAVKLANRTGVETVAGQLVKADTATDDGVILTAADDDECMGVFLDSGVADDADAWVVVAGIADVAFQDNTAATHGNWVRVSITEAGYADGTNAAPPGGGIPELDRHMHEIGHSIETVLADGAGTHISAHCVLHFN